MEIQLNNIAKRFNTNWVFKNIDYSFSPGKTYAITGSNGSGKSTLLKILAAYFKPSKGEVKFLLNGEVIQEENVFKHLVYCAPYIDIEASFTLNEFFRFYFSIKKPKDNQSITEVIEGIGLSNSAKKQLLDFSSGMLQKVKLAAAFNTEARLYLFDEPTMNLDEENKKWFQNNLNQISAESIVIIASNDEEEYQQANSLLDIGAFK